MRSGRDPLVLLFFAVMLAVGLALIAQSIVVGRAWVLHRNHQIDDEIAWLEQMRPLLPWERGLDAQIDKRYRERVRVQLDAGQLEPAVQTFREARTHLRQAGKPIEPELMALGIEVYTRAADHVEKLGRLSAAADWDDSLFVLAVRADEPHHRYAAVAAFTEALDLRVRDGQPCAALARVTWAKRGLGGVVPNLPEGLESDLTQQCAGSKRGGARR